MRAFGQIAALCVAGALICSVLRGYRPEMKLAVALATGLSATCLMLDGLGESVAALSSLAEQAFSGSQLRGILLRAAGVAAVAEFAARLCEDAGESALAGRIEMGGRVALTVLALPVLRELTGQLVGLLP